MSSNILEPFLNMACSNDNKMCLELYSKLNGYLENKKPSNLDCLDLVKFFDATCLFLQSDSVQSDSLILIQLFIQSLSELLQKYLDNSMVLFYVLFCYSHSSWLENISLK